MYNFIKYQNLTILDGKINDYDNNNNTYIQYSNQNQNLTLSNETKVNRNKSQNQNQKIAEKIINNQNTINNLNIK